MELVIRADCGPEIGAGHVMRCLALGQGWQDAGGRVALVMARKLSLIDSRLRSEGMEIADLEVEPGSQEDASRTADLALRMGADWVVVDGYQFGADFQRILKDSGLRLLFLDDIGGSGHYWADMVLNQNFHGDESLYSDREPYTRLLLGPRYALLRREFLPWKGWIRDTPQVASKVLISLGGGDYHQETLNAIRALNEVGVDALEGIVVTGDSGPHDDELESAVLKGHVPIQLKRGVSDMASLMSWADVAICGAGSTCWELAFMGLPSLVLVLADNQRPVGNELAKRGALINLGWHSGVSCQRISESLQQLLIARDQRASMSQRGRSIVDGEGAKRVASKLTRTPLRLRRASPDDCRLFWNWSNDSTTRQSSFSPDPICWGEHAQWFSGKLRDPNCVIYVALDESGGPVGQIRFDFKNNQEAEIDISVDRNRRGRGYATSLIRCATAEVFCTTAVERVNAFVKVGNIASLRAFENAGFQRLDLVMVAGNPTVHFARTRNYA